MKTLILAALWLSFTGHAFCTSSNAQPKLTNVNSILNNLNNTIFPFQDTVHRSRPTTRPSKTSGKKQPGKDSTTHKRKSQDTTRRY